MTTYRARSFLPQTMIPPWWLACTTRWTVSPATCSSPPSSSSSPHPSSIWRLAAFWATSHGRLEAGAAWSAPPGAWPWRPWSPPSSWRGRRRYTWHRMCRQCCSQWEKESSGRRMTKPKLHPCSSRSCRGNCSSTGTSATCGGIACCSARSTFTFKTFRWTTTAQGDSSVPIRRRFPVAAPPRCNRRWWLADWPSTATRCHRLTRQGLAM
mmetsp:Transcript_36354/g.83853  ORF Transcript_36354/g.83853 Transcript_36354/m.83853 type:complete len:210 (-) Transcript_36354:355-984(-)